MAKTKHKAKSKRATAPTSISKKAHKPKTPKPDPLAPPDFSIPKSLATPVQAKGLKHAKWPALCKKHIGLLESHVKSVDRMMQSLKSEMENLSVEERTEWELDETGNWRVVCEMLDRAREVLMQGKRIAMNILPPDVIKDKKGLGLKGLKFEKLGPPLAARAREVNYKGAADKKPEIKDEDEESDIEEVEDGPDWSSPKAEGQVAKASVPLPQSDGQAGSLKKTEINAPVKPISKDISPNPYSIVDTKSTPVNLEGNAKSKKVERSKKEQMEAHWEKQASETRDAAESELNETKAPKQEKSSDKKRAAADEDGESQLKEAKKSRREDTPNAKHEKKKRAIDDGDEERKIKKSKKSKDSTFSAAAKDAAKESHPPQAMATRKRTKDHDDEEKMSKKLKLQNTKGVPNSPQDPVEPEDVDYPALEAKLFAEIEAGLQAKQQQEGKAAEKEQKKKRKRESEGEKPIEKKSKTEKKKTKDKKRKAGEGADGEEVNQSSKRKRKHRG